MVRKCLHIVNASLDTDIKYCIMAYFIYFLLCSVNLVPGASCLASSVYGPKYLCTKAFDGSLKPHGGEWATKGQGQGSWIEIHLKHTYVVNKFRAMQRYSRLGQSKQAVLTFSDGSKQRVRERRYSI